MMKKIIHFCSAFWRSFDGAISLKANALILLLMFAACSKDNSSETPSPTSKDNSSTKKWDEQPVIKEGEPSYLSFYTTKALGEKISLTTSGVGWVDLNNNGVQDSDEKIDITAGKRAKEYTLNSHVVTLYGNYTYFRANEAEIKAIDVSHSSYLLELDVSRNALTELNLKENGLLVNVNVSENNLNKPAIEALARSLPQKEVADKATILLKSYLRGACERNRVEKQALDLLVPKNWDAQCFSTLSGTVSYEGNPNLIVETVDMGWKTNPVINKERGDYITLYTTIPKGGVIYLNAFGKYNNSNIAWVDLNNNGIQDEESVSSEQPKFVVDSPVITIYNDNGYEDEESKFINFSASGKIVAIDVSHYRKLTNLYLSQNALTSLDLSKNYLSSLDVSYNALTSLDLKKQKYLNILKLQGNQLKEATMTTLADDLNSVSYDGHTESCSIVLQDFRETIQEGNQISKVILTILSDKGWYPEHIKRDGKRYLYRGNPSPSPIPKP